jgi:hypothetical protein
MGQWYMHSKEHHLPRQRIIAALNEFAEFATPKKGRIRAKTVIYKRYLVVRCEHGS